MPAAVGLLGRAVAALSQDAAAHEGKARSLGLNAARRELLSRRSRDLARRILDSDELKDSTRATARWPRGS